MFNRLATSFVLAITLSSPLGFAWAQESVTAVEQLEEVLSTVVVAYALETHVSVGLIADSYAGNVLEAAGAKALIDMRMTLLHDLGPKLTSLSKRKEIGPDGQKFLIESTNVFRTIRAELTALSEYLKSDSKADQKKYNSARDSAQNAIDDYLKN